MPYQLNPRPMPAPEPRKPKWWETLLDVGTMGLSAGLSAIPGVGPLLGPLAGAGVNAAAGAAGGGQPQPQPQQPARRQPMRQPQPAPARRPPQQMGRFAGWQPPDETGWIDPIIEQQQVMARQPRRGPAGPMPQRPMPPTGVPRRGPAGLPPTPPFRGEVIPGNDASTWRATRRVEDVPGNDASRWTMTSRVPGAAQPAQPSYLQNPFPGAGRASFADLTMGKIPPEVLMRLRAFAEGNQGQNEPWWSLP